MKFQSLIPILYCSDIQQSFAYYTQKLGFEKKWDWGNPVDFGCVGKDEVEIFLCDKNQGQPGTWLCINVDNVDEYYKDINARGADILAAPADKEWGMREMLVKAPDGHIIRFGHLIECE